MEFDGNEVKSSDYLKILGVTIDNKLTFSEHVSDICMKTSCKVEVLFRLRNIIINLMVRKVTAVQVQYFAPPNIL